LRAARMHASSSLAPWSRSVTVASARALDVTSAPACTSRALAASVLAPSSITAPADQHTTGSSSACACNGQAVRGLHLAAPSSSTSELSLSLLFLSTQHTRTHTSQGRRHGFAKDTSLVSNRDYIFCSFSLIKQTMYNVLNRQHTRATPRLHSARLPATNARTNPLTNPD
jgi:hypothetical protein